MQFVQRGLRPVDDENRSRGPEGDEPLPLLDLADVDVDRAGRRDRRRVGIHLVDEWPDRRGDADRADRAGRQIEKIAARRLGGRGSRGVRGRMSSCVGFPVAKPAVPLVSDNCITRRAIFNNRRRRGGRPISRAQYRRYCDRRIFASASTMTR